MMAEKVGKMGSKLKPMAARAVDVYARIFAQMTTPASQQDISKEEAEYKKQILEELGDGRTFKAVQKAAKKVFEKAVGKLNKAQRDLFKLSLKELELLVLRPPSLSMQDLGRSYFRKIKRTDMMRLAVMRMLMSKENKVDPKKFKYYYKLLKKYISAKVFQWVEKFLGTEIRKALEWSFNNMKTILQAAVLIPRAIRFAHEAGQMTTIQGLMGLLFTRLSEAWYDLKQRGLDPTESQNPLISGFVRRVLYMAIWHTYGGYYAVPFDISVATINEFYSALIVPADKILLRRFPPLKSQRLQIMPPEKGGIGVAFNAPVLGNIDDKTLISSINAFATAARDVQDFFAIQATYAYLTAKGSAKDRIAQTAAFFKNQTLKLPKKRIKEMDQFAKYVENSANWTDISEKAAGIVGGTIVGTVVAGGAAVITMFAYGHPVSATIILLGAAYKFAKEDEPGEGRFGGVFERERTPEEQKEYDRLNINEYDEDFNPRLPEKPNVEEEGKDEDDDDDDEDLGPIDNLDPVIPRPSGGEGDTDVPMLPAPGDPIPPPPPPPPPAQIQARESKNKERTGALTLMKTVVEGYVALTEKNRAEKLLEQLKEAKRMNKIMLEKEQEQLQAILRYQRYGFNDPNPLIPVYDGGDVMERYRGRIAVRYEIENNLEGVSDQVQEMARGNSQLALIQSTKERVEKAIREQGNPKFRNKSTSELRTQIAKTGKKFSSDMQRIIGRRREQGAFEEKEEKEYEDVLRRQDEAAQLMSRESKEGETTQVTRESKEGEPVQLARESKEGESAQLMPREGKTDVGTDMQGDADEEFLDARESVEDPEGARSIMQSILEDERKAFIEELNSAGEVEDDGGLISLATSTNEAMAEVEQEIVTRSDVTNTIMREFTEEEMSDFSTPTLFDFLPPQPEAANPFAEEKLAEDAEKAAAAEAEAIHLERAAAREAYLKSALDKLTSGYELLRTGTSAAAQGASLGLDVGMDLTNTVARNIATAPSQARAFLRDERPLPTVESALGLDSDPIFLGEMLPDIKIGEMLSGIKSITGRIFDYTRQRVITGQFVLDLHQAKVDALRYGVREQRGFAFDTIQTAARYGVNAARMYAEVFKGGQPVYRPGSLYDRLQRGEYEHTAQLSRLLMPTPNTMLPLEFNEEGGVAIQDEIIGRRREGFMSNEQVEDLLVETETILSPYMLFKTIMDKAGVTGLVKKYFKETIKMATKWALSFVRYLAETGIKLALQAGYQIAMYVPRLTFQLAGIAADFGARGIAIALEQAGFGPWEIAYNYLIDPRRFVAFIGDTYFNMAPEDLIYRALDPARLSAQFANVLRESDTVASLTRIGELLSEGRVLGGIAEFSAGTQSAFYSDLGHGLAGALYVGTEIVAGVETAEAVAGAITFLSEKFGYVAIPLLVGSIGYEIYDSLHNPMYKYVPNANISKWADIAGGLIPNPLWVSYFLRIFGVKKIGDLKFMTMSELLDAIPAYHEATQTQMQHYHDAVNEDANMDFSKFHPNNDPALNLYLNPEVVSEEDFGIINYVRGGSPQLYQLFLSQLPPVKDATEFVGDPTGGVVVPFQRPIAPAEDSPRNRLRYAQWLIASHDYFLKQNGLVDTSQTTDFTDKGKGDIHRIVLPSWWNEINKDRYEELVRNGTIKILQTPKGRSLALTSSMNFLKELDYGSLISPTEGRDMMGTLDEILQESGVKPDDVPGIIEELVEAYVANPNQLEGTFPRLTQAIQDAATAGGKTTEVVKRIVAAAFRVFFVTKKKVERDRRLEVSEMATAPRGAGLEASKTEFAEATGKTDQVFETAGFGGAKLTLHGRGNRAKTAADLMVEEQSTQSQLAFMLSGLPATRFAKFLKTQGASWLRENKLEFAIPYLDAGVSMGREQLTPQRIDALLNGLQRQAADLGIEGEAAVRYVGRQLGFSRDALQRLMSIVENSAQTAYNAATQSAFAGMGGAAAAAAGPFPSGVDSNPVAAEPNNDAPPPPPPPSGGAGGATRPGGSTASSGTRTHAGAHGLRRLYDGGTTGIPPPPPTNVRTPDQRKRSGLDKFSGSGTLPPGKQGGPVVKPGGRKPNIPPVTPAPPAQPQTIIVQQPKSEQSQSPDTNLQDPAAPKGTQLEAMFKQMKAQLVGQQSMMASIQALKIQKLQPQEETAINQLAEKYPLIVDHIKNPSQFDALCTILVAGASVYGEQASRTLFGSTLETVDTKPADPTTRALQELIEINKSILSLQQHQNEAVKKVNVDKLTDLVDKSIVEPPKKKRKIMDNSRTGIIRIGDVPVISETPTTAPEVEKKNIGFGSFLKLPRGTNNSAVRFAGTLDMDVSDVKLRIR